MSTTTSTDYGQEVHPPGTGARPDVVSLSEYAKVLLRWWLIVTACTLVGIVLGVLAFAVIPRTYQAQVTVALLPMPEQTGQGSSRSVDMTGNEINSYAKSPDVANLAKATLEKTYPDYAGMRAGQVLAKASFKAPDANSQAIIITFKAGSAAEAAAGANAIADAYLTYRGQKGEDYLKRQADKLNLELTRTLDEEKKLSSIIAGLADNAPTRSAQTKRRDNYIAEAATLQSQINVLNGTSTNPGTITGRATPPAGPSFPKLPIFAMGGLVLGLLAGIVLALRRESKDDTVRGARDINRAGAGPLLANVRVPRKLPAGSGMALLTAPTSDEAQGYRLFAAKLQAPHLQVGGRLLFTGSYGGDTRVPLNLAIALSRMGNRVLLLASGQVLMETFGQLGLTESALYGVGYHGDHCGVALSGLPDLLLAPLRDDDMPTTNYLIDHAGELVDYVLVDDASSPAAWRTLALSTVVDGVYVITTLGRNGRRSLRRLCEELTSVRARIMGTVMLVGSKVPAPPASLKGANLGTVSPGAGRARSRAGAGALSGSGADSGGAGGSGAGRARAASAEVGANRDAAFRVGAGQSAQAAASTGVSSVWGSLGTEPAAERTMAVPTSPPAGRPGSGGSGAGGSSGGGARPAGGTTSSTPGASGSPSAQTPSPGQQKPNATNTNNEPGGAGGGAASAHYSPQGWNATYGVGPAGSGAGGGGSSASLGFGGQSIGGHGLGGQGFQATTSTSWAGRPSYTEASSAWATQPAGWETGQHAGTQQGAEPATVLRTRADELGTQQPLPQQTQPSAWENHSEAGHAQRRDQPQNQLQDQAQDSGAGQRGDAPAWAHTQQEHTQQEHTQAFAPAALPEATKPEQPAQQASEQTRHESTQQSPQANSARAAGEVPDYLSGPLTSGWSAPSQPNPAPSDRDLGNERAATDEFGADPNPKPDSGSGYRPNTAALRREWPE